MSLSTARCGVGRWFFACLLCSECWFGNFLATLQSLLPPTLHGSACSLFLFAGSLVGSLAPFALGCADRRLALLDGGGDHLGMLLGWSVTASLVGCAALFHVARCDSVVVGGVDTQSKALGHAVWGLRWTC